MFRSLLVLASSSPVRRFQAAAADDPAWEKIFYVPMWNGKEF